MDYAPFVILGLICTALVLAGGFMAVGIYRNRHRGG